MSRERAGCNEMLIQEKHRVTHRKTPPSYDVVEPQRLQGRQLKEESPSGRDGMTEMPFVSRSSLVAAICRHNRWFTFVRRRNLEATLCRCYRLAVTARLDSKGPLWFPGTEGLPVAAA